MKKVVRLEFTRGAQTKFIPPHLSQQVADNFKSPHRQAKAAKASVACTVFFACLLEIASLISNIMLTKKSGTLVASPAEA